jgi:hypothetical protein
VIPAFQLEANPMDAFNNTMNSSEDVFALQQDQVSNTGSAGTRSGLAAHIASFPNFGLAAMRILPESLNSDFLSNNPRYQAIDARAVTNNSITDSSTPDNLTGNEGYYNDPVNTLTISSAKYTRNTDIVPIIRLAELLLSRAEAIHELSFSTPIGPLALADVNAIRTRAGLPALLDTLSAFQFYDSLVLERNRELLYEGIIFHDLKRWAAAGNDVEISFTRDPLDSEFILPIPQSECDTSPGLCN